MEFGYSQIHDKITKEPKSGQWIHPFQQLHLPKGISADNGIASQAENRYHPVVSQRTHCRAVVQGGQNGQYRRANLGQSQTQMHDKVRSCQGHSQSIFVPCEMLCCRYNRSTSLMIGL
jgi:hypothetical protein